MYFQNCPFEVSHLYYAYEHIPVLRDITFQIPPGGGLVGIIGPNGAGKSSFLKCAIGALVPQEGSVTFWGQPFQKYCARVAYVPQRSSIDWDFPITVSEVVKMGAYARLGLWGRFGKEEKKRLLQSLEEVGLIELADRQIGCLSGGQQQKVFLARALMQDPEVLLMDEPFAGIDATSCSEIMCLLKRMASNEKTILVVHHDLMIVPKFFNWLVLLNKHLIAFGTVEEVFTSEKLTKVYGPSAYLLDEIFQRSAQFDTFSL